MRTSLETQNNLKVKDLQALIGHISSCLGERSQKAVISALAWLQGMAECDGAVVCQLHPKPEPDLRLVINQSYSSEWLKTYRREKFHRLDPVLQYAMSTQGAYDWWRAYAELDTSGANHFIEAAEDYGLRGGLAYSYTDPVQKKGEKAITVCSLASRRGHINHEARYALHSLMPALHLAASGSELNSGSEVHLTDRELVVLRWGASGKTAWEISVILSVSESTVKFHLANAYRKLNVTNRAQAISAALNMGLL